MATWFLTNPDHTEESRLPDEDGAPTFVVGFFPPQQDVAIRARLPVLSKPDEAIDPVKDQDEFIRHSGMQLEAYREAARWGCRGWRGAPAGFEAKTETIRLGGRDHTALTYASVDLLYANGLLGLVAMRAIAFNILSAEQQEALKKSSLETSPTLPTGAPSVSPGSTNPTSPSGSSPAAVPTETSPRRSEA